MINTVMLIICLIPIAYYIFKLKDFDSTGFKYEGR